MYGLFWRQYIVFFLVLNFKNYMKINFLYSLRKIEKIGLENALEIHCLSQIELLGSDRTTHSAKILGDPHNISTWYHLQLKDHIKVNQARIKQGCYRERMSYFLYVFIHACNEDFGTIDCSKQRCCRGAFSDFSLQVVLVIGKNALRWFW